MKVWGYCKGLEVFTLEFAFALDFYTATGSSLFAYTDDKAVEPLLITWVYAEPVDIGLDFVCELLIFLNSFWFIEPIGTLSLLVCFWIKRFYSSILY